MKSVLVTVSGPESSRDLAVPADTPIEQLLPTFLSLGVVDESGANGAGFAVSRAGEPPLPAGSSLADCGVVDGTVLILAPVEPEEKPLRPKAPQPIEMEEWEKREEHADLKRRAGFPLKRTESALPDAPRFGERFGSAWTAWWGRGEEEPRRAVPTRVGEDEPPPGPGDLTVAQPPSRMTRARASWRETSYIRRLEVMTATPRLRRCSTIAVVSPKGGVGKTTMTALLGALLVRVRHERVVAVDTNPDYGSLGRALTPDHRVFVDDLVDVLDHPDLAVTELDRKLGRAFDGLMVLPAPTDPARMARLDQASYAKVFSRLKTLVGGLVLDCGTGLQEPAARAAIEAADQIVLVSDAEPSTASLVAEAARLLTRATPPMYLVVNKWPKKGGRLDLEQLSRAVPDARALLVLDADPAAASRLAAGDFSWDEAPETWKLGMRELAAVMVSDWPELGLAA